MRIFCSRRERADRIRVNVFLVIVWPADGEPFTIVPSVGVGDGEGLLERKSGWILCSRLSAKLKVDWDGDSKLKVLAVGDGFTRLSRDC